MFSMLFALKGIMVVFLFVLKNHLNTNNWITRLSFDWGHICRHIFLCVKMPYPALYPVLVKDHRKESWTLNLWTCVWVLTGYFQYSVFLSFSLFLLVNPLTLIPMVYYSPTSSTFSSCPSFILLIPHLTFSPTPAFMSCHLAFILWFSNCNLSFITTVFYNVSPTLFLSISLLTFFLLLCKLCTPCLVLSVGG